MARPKKNIEDLHCHSASVRFTTAEYVRLQHTARSMNISVSEFIRRRALGHRLPPVSSDQELIAKLTNALLRLGVNLNQVAKIANIKEKVLSNMLYDLIVRINEKMDELDESNRD